MAGRVVQASVTVQRALRFTIRSPAAHTVHLEQSTTDTSSTNAVPQHSCAIALGASQAAAGKGLLADYFVSEDLTPDEVVAIMVGASVHGKSTFAIPTKMLTPSRPTVSISSSVSQDQQPGLPHSQAPPAKTISGAKTVDDEPTSELLHMIVPESAQLATTSEVHALIAENALSAKDIASAVLTPAELSRNEFQQLQDNRRSHTVGGRKTVDKEHATETLKTIQGCTELALECDAQGLREFVGRHEVNPATMRCGDEEATLLHFAASHSPLLPVDEHTISEMFRLLVREFAIPVDAGTRNGATALHWAAGHGNTTAVIALLEAGASPLARTWTWDRSVFGRGSGQTPLHWAAESGHDEVVDVLLHAANGTVPGVDASVVVAVPDERGQTPADVAGHNLQWDLHEKLSNAENLQYVFVDVEAAVDTTA